eukprot:1973874-Prorocentrum_lima.AAC.1
MPDKTVINSCEAWEMSLASAKSCTKATMDMVSGVSKTEYTVIELSVLTCMRCLLYTSPSPRDSTSS